MARPIHHLFTSKRVILHPQVLHTVLHAICHAVEQDDMERTLECETRTKACTVTVNRYGKRPRVEVVS